MSLLGPHSRTIVAVAALAGAAAARGADAQYTFAPIEVPGARDTEASGVDEGGRVVGYYRSSDLTTHGFTYHAGRLGLFDVSGAQSTAVYGINAAGQIVGTVAGGRDAPFSGFLYSGGAFTFFDVAGALGTNASGINAAGQIVGWYATGAGARGYLAPPVPEPGTFALVVAALGGLGGVVARRRRCRGPGPPAMTAG